MQTCLVWYVEDAQTYINWFVELHLELTHFYRNQILRKNTTIMEKGFFPYDYIDCVEKLDEMCLPSRESFYSLLTSDTVSDSDYAHAAKVWQRFFIQTLGEYSDLYLKTDVLLLADIFENFRDSCVTSYGLDPAYYYTLPGFYIRRDVKTYARQFWTAYRHRHSHVRQRRYMRRFESMLRQQIRASQQ